MKRIKYISRFAAPMTARDIERIAAQSAAKNRKLGITGLLMATGGVFFQVIEGPDDALDKLYSRILRDPRHRDVLTLRVEEGNLTRLFPGWEMKKVDLDTATDLRPGAAEGHHPGDHAPRRDHQRADGRPGAGGVARADPRRPAARQSSRRRAVRRPRGRGRKKPAARG